MLYIIIALALALVFTAALAYRGRKRIRALEATPGQDALNTVAEAEAVRLAQIAQRAEEKALELTRTLAQRNHQIATMRKAGEANLEAAEAAEKRVKDIMGRVVVIEDDSHLYIPYP